MNTLSILSNEIRNVSGLYSLNDLHKAAGAANKHSPRYWSNNEQTKELIREIEKDGIPSIEKKQRQGTWVCKELVYAYAMWISAKFHLHVIRAFDQLALSSQPLSSSDALPSSEPSLSSALSRSHPSNTVSSGEQSGKEVSVNEPLLPVITLETLTASILALANKRSERNVPVESYMITEAVMKYLGVIQLSDADAVQLEKGLSFIQTAIEGEYQGRTTHQTDEYIASLERRLESYEKRMKLIHSHTRVLKRDFQSIISPTLKETNSGLYGNAREHLHVAHMYSTVY